MLVTWSKRLPRSMDRIDMLSHALTCIRRTDLAEELLARQEEFKNANALHFKDSYLRKAFVTIAKHPRAVLQWKQLARFLGVADSDITYIETCKDTTPERCLSSLHLWKDRNGHTATVPLLANKLRQCRYRKLAREIECIS
ncbi:unnamed protein product [Lymnaea stagnalis]|uniref:Death domain-containing protein n=1 Tax=Lymnaea stagnalis TaxID=6523 RepID=A0AAV2HPB8_LYMST